MKPQTRAQNEVYTILCQQVSKLGRPVTIAEIASMKAMAISTVWKHLQNLIQDGLVAHRAGRMGYEPRASTGNDQAKGWRNAVAHLRNSIGVTMAKHHAPQSLVTAVTRDLDEANAAVEEP